MDLRNVIFAIALSFAVLFGWAVIFETPQIQDENQSEKIIALIGPTNTGKTHVAIEKMLEFNTGIFGLPLRLLAREVYDKVVKNIGLDKVALITGEENVIPSKAKYFLCTVESMPIDKFLDFDRFLLYQKWLKHPRDLKKQNFDQIHKNLS